MPVTAKEKREQLIREGYCIFENVLSPEMVTKLNTMSEWTIAQEDPAHFDQHRAHGCIIPYWRYPTPHSPNSSPIHVRWRFSPNSDSTVPRCGADS